VTTEKKSTLTFFIALISRNAHPIVPFQLHRRLISSKISPFPLIPSLYFSQLVLVLYSGYMQSGAIQLMVTEYRRQSPIVLFAFSIAFVGIKDVAYTRLFLRKLCSTRSNISTTFESHVVNFNDFLIYKIPVGCQPGSPEPKHLKTLYSWSLIGALALNQDPLTLTEISNIILLFERERIGRNDGLGGFGKDKAEICQGTEDHQF
jgi:hypothetical protein